MVQDPADYRHSSFGCNGLGRPDRLITQHGTYLALGSNAATRCAAYRSVLQASGDPAEIQEIRHATASCRLYGNDHFRDDVALRLARSVRPGKPGRPRKIAV
jgi:putative transposase